MRILIFSLISALIGIELFVGITIAPTIFFPQKFNLEVPITHFQSGLLMTRVFIHLGYLLFGVSILAFLNTLRHAKTQKINTIITGLTLILASIFAFYFTPVILQFQAQGELATLTEEFKKIHLYSEWCLKFTMLLQALTLLLSIKTFKKI